MSEFLIGVDLGGTNIRAGLISTEGKVLESIRVPTANQTTRGEVILQQIANLISELISLRHLKKEQIICAGVGSPGPLVPAIGGVDTPNIKQLNGLPMTKILEELTGLKVLLENDANAAAWGEYWKGAGRCCKTMVQATLGTGIGGGLIIDGNLLRGADHSAAEIGHIIVVAGGRQCACGAQGCIEAYASANSTVKRFCEALEAGRKSALNQADSDPITCEKIFKAADQDDALSSEIVTETGKLLGILAADMANLLNPDVFVFSGGMIQAGELLFSLIREECKKLAFNAPAARMQILPAALGEDAGIIGAAGCALKTFATSQ